MIELFGDPYEGARAAYQALNPESTDEGWEAWITENQRGSNRDFDSFKDLALLCREASEIQMEPATAKHVAYAAGYFQAMERVLTSLTRTLPISSCVPHHAPRYQASLINPDAQFE